MMSACARLRVHIRHVENNSLKCVVLVGGSPVCASGDIFVGKSLNQFKILLNSLLAMKIREDVVHIIFCCRADRVSRVAAILSVQATAGCWRPSPL